MRTFTKYGGDDFANPIITYSIILLSKLHQFIWTWFNWPNSQFHPLYRHRSLPDQHDVEWQFRQWSRRTRTIDSVYSADMCTMGARWSTQFECSLVCLNVLCFWRNQENPNLVDFKTYFHEQQAQHVLRVYSVYFDRQSRHSAIVEAAEVWVSWRWRWVVVNKFEGSTRILKIDDLHVSVKYIVVNLLNAGGHFCRHHDYIWKWLIRSIFGQRP